MDGSRFRLGAILEWVLAAAAFGGAVGAAAYVRQEIRGIEPVTPVIAREAPPRPPAVPVAVPPRAVSVPLLLLENGAQVRVGEPMSLVLGRLDGAVEIAPGVSETTGAGIRLVRAFRLGRVGFRLVFDSTGVASEPQLSAIYR